MLCLLLQVSRSAYYGWLSTCEVVDKREQETETAVTQAFQEHMRRYEAAGLEAIQPRSFVPRITDSRHPHPISPNLLVERPFPTGPNQVWVGDITYIPLAGSGSVPKGMVVHSDRGGQYAGNAFRKLIDGKKAIQSMSRADNPYDNAFMESCFSRFKAELLEDGAFENKQDAQTQDL